MNAITNLLDAASLDRLARALAARAEAFDALLDAQPQERVCHIHKPQTAILNREASYDAAKPVYSCAACQLAKRQQRRSSRIIAAGIPADVRHATLENFQTYRENVKEGNGLKTPLRFLEDAMRFANGEVRNLILGGTPGIGKGHLAAALAIKAIDSGATAGWLECSRLFALFHEAYATNSTEAVISRCVNPSLFVLDEVCFRDLPKDGEEVLFSVLDRRHKAGRQTVILSNKPSPVVREWLGDRVSDRLRSGGVISCYGEWDSMRGKAGDGADEF